MLHDAKEEVIQQDILRQYVKGSKRQGVLKEVKHYTFMKLIKLIKQTTQYLREVPETDQIYQTFPFPSLCKHLGLLKETLRQVKLPGII